MTGGRASCGDSRLFAVSCMVSFRAIAFHARRIASACEDVHDQVGHGLDQFVGLLLGESADVARALDGRRRRHGSRPPQREEEILDGRMGREGDPTERRPPVGRGLVLERRRICAVGTMQARSAPPSFSKTTTSPPRPRSRSAPARPIQPTRPCSDCRSTRPTAMDSGHVTLTPHGGQDHHRVERQGRTDFHHTDC